MLSILYVKETNILSNTVALQLMKGKQCTEAWKSVNNIYTAIKKEKKSHDLVIFHHRITCD